MEENALTETGGEWLGLVSLLLADSLLSMLSVSLVFSPGARPWLGVQASTGPPGPPASAEEASQEGAAPLPRPQSSACRY